MNATSAHHRPRVQKLHHVHPEHQRPSAKQRRVARMRVTRLTLMIRMEVRDYLNQE